MMSLQQLNRIVSLPYALLMTAAKHVLIQMALQGSSVKVFGLVRILTQTTLDAAPVKGTMHVNHMLLEASLWANAAAADIFLVIQGLVRLLSQSVVIVVYPSVLATRVSSNLLNFSVSFLMFLTAFNSFLLLKSMLMLATMHGTKASHSTFNTMLNPLTLLSFQALENRAVTM
jgi:hypothetical protein